MNANWKCLFCGLKFYTEKWGLGVKCPDCDIQAVTIPKDERKTNG